MIADDHDPVRLQAGKMRAGHRRTTAGVNTVENDRWRTGHPQLPARTDLALDLCEDLPAGLWTAFLLVRRIDLIVNDGQIRLNQLQIFTKSSNSACS